MKSYIVSLIIAWLLSPASAFSADKIYKWVDENGVICFSNVPPPEKKLQELHIREGIDRPKHPVKANSLYKKSSTKKLSINRNKKRAEYYFNKAEKLIEKGDYGRRRQADILRSIGKSYLNCPGRDIKKAQIYYKQAEDKINNINKCTSINRGKTWYNAACVKGIIKEAWILKKMGDSYMGCSNQYITRLDNYIEQQEKKEEIESLKLQIQTLQSDMMFKD